MIADELRALIACYPGREFLPLIQRAIDTIDRLEAENARLRTRLLSAAGDKAMGAGEVQIPPRL